MPSVRTRLAGGCKGFVFLGRFLCEGVFMGKSRKNFYAVRVGRNTGIYNSWSECEAQVKQYPGAQYKGFASHSDAQEFVDGSTHGYSRPNNSYAHQRYSGNFTSRARHFSSGNDRSDCSYFYSPPSCSGHCGVSTSDHRPVVYSDGCCLNNGFAGARAGIGVYWGDGSSHNVSEPLKGHQTNQRAELVSACRAIESAMARGYSSVEVKTDSAYTIKAATQWIKKWKGNGWHTADGGAVKNKPDLERLDGLCSRMDVKWTHVNGHVGIPGNEAADSLAKLGSRK